MRYVSTKVIPMGSTAFRQWRAESHCKLIHGYRLQCKLWFTADDLDERNWVFDFGGCKEIKKILEHQFDHTTVVAADDPELVTFKIMSDRGMIDLRIAEKGVGIERTAEWVYDHVDKYVEESTEGRVRVVKVEVWEHEGNSAIYEENEKQCCSKLKKLKKSADKPSKTEAAVVGNSVAEVPVQTKSVLQTKPEIKVSGKKERNGLYAKKTTGMGNLFAGTSWED